MCVGAVAPILNPGGFALSKLPVPGFISDPAQALTQAVVGKNVLTDPTYKTARNTPGPVQTGTFAGTVPVTPQQDDTNRRAFAATALSDDGVTAKKTALGQ